MGKFVAFMDILTLGLYPRFWGDMHFNPKDIPITAMFSFVLVLFYYWYQSPKKEMSRLLYHGGNCTEHPPYLVALSVC